MKVWSRDGEEAWVLVHIEVQEGVEQAFAKRMYVYNYRIFDRYDKRVVSLAVLADRQPAWRPTGTAMNCGAAGWASSFPWSSWSTMRLVGVNWSET